MAVLAPVPEQPQHCRMVAMGHCIHLQVGYCIIDRASVVRCPICLSRYLESRIDHS